MKKMRTITHALPWIICGLGALFYAYEYFLRITPSVMTAELMRFYHIHDAALGSLSAYYYYIYTPMQLAAGVLMDRYGPRRLLTLATLSCVIGSILFAATHHLWVAEIGRFLIGFGSAFAFVGVLKLATIWLPRRYFATFTGCATALGMLGAVIGDLTMTKMVQFFGWQDTAFISAIFGIFLAILIGSFVRDHKKYGREQKIIRKQVSYNEAFAGLLRIVKTPQIWIAGLVGSLLFTPASAFAELWGIPYLESSHGLSPEVAAFGASLVFIGWAIGGPIVGIVSDKINRRALPMAVCSFLCALTFFAILFIPHLPTFAVFGMLFLAGIFASSQALVFAIGRELGPERLAGSSIAFTNMMVMLGGVVLQPLIGYLLDLLWKGKIAHGIQVFSIHDYQTAMSLIPIGLIIGSFICLFILKDTNKKSLKLTTS